ncbi:MAG: ribosome biogenesis GTPase Der [Verrucomicrobia bacterium]|jgi:GTP-binding protein|nr:ribosome biogenesis GTPase Der [Verrucomicrobiota bacterium]
MSGLIAIVGRPNVGKSALFNRIARKRIAIVHDEPGVTRDRVMAEVEWHGRPFTLVDTGGIGMFRNEKSSDVIAKAAIEQVNIAIEAANVIILVVNVQEGVVPLDREVAEHLRKSKKTVLVAANKVDSPSLENATAEFTELGFDNIFPLTAIHGFGIQEIMDEAMKFIPETIAVDPDVSLEKENLPLKLAIVGRPNVGKSSIINALTQSDRVIVSAIPGTTRDAVDVPFEVETEGVRQKYVLIDTAGVRQERRIDNSIEFYSVKRTEESISRCDIAIFVLDAVTGILGQDKKIADKITSEHKACIIVINKWDLMAEDVQKAREEEIEKRAKNTAPRGDAKFMTTLVEFGEWVQEKLFFLDYAPVIFTSAKSGFHLDRLLEAVRYVAAQLKQKVPTSILNRTLNTAIEKRQPVSAAGHRLKFFYATQVRQAPPTFLMFVNKNELFSDQYNKYLSGEMRKAFGYEGCPILLVPKPRPKTIEPVRRFNMQKKKDAGERPTPRPKQVTKPKPKSKTKTARPRLSKAHTVPTRKNTRRARRY